MEDKAKIERCKYSHPHFKNNSIEYHCVVDGWEDDKVRICKKGECESCQRNCCNQWINRRKSKCNVRDVKHVKRKGSSIQKNIVALVFLMMK